MDDVKFTIAICTYNGEKTLERAIESVLALLKFDDWVEEFLLIDNASNDNTAKICKAYQEKNEKIHYIFEAKPGLSNARRCAVVAKGDWVIYVDDDNILSEDWLIGLQETIRANPKAGVINGAVIATPVEKLNEYEEIRLNLMYRRLACTHIYSINFQAKENTEPIGAGMCVKASALKIVSENGWLSLIGRKGNQLSSGEDTELSRKIFEQGYVFVSNYDMKLLHLIPKCRLSEEYVDKLLIGLTKGWYYNINQKKYYLLARSARLIKYLFVLIKSNICMAFIKDKMKKEKNRERCVIAREFISCGVEDHLLFR